jgi:hypothetical protein
MASIQPSLRDLCNPEFFPALKRRAIFRMSRWDKTKAGKPDRAGIQTGDGDLIYKLKRYLRIIISVNP